MPDALDALRKLHKAVIQEGGNLFITDLFRSWNVQSLARQEFLDGKKKAFVAPPGNSFHGAGRAIDFDVFNLNFSSVLRHDWLGKFWSIAIPLGWFPIISRPDMHLSECWHFEYPGEDWLPAYKRLPNKLVAKCAILDCGQWSPDTPESVLRAMFIQAQLVRLGRYEIVPDGIVGRLTRTALADLGLGSLSLEQAAERLAQL